jgi:hypothetical protein
MDLFPATVVVIWRVTDVFEAFIGQVNVRTFTMPYQP